MTRVLFCTSPDAYALATLRRLRLSGIGARLVRAFRFQAHRRSMDLLVRQTTAEISLQRDEQDQSSQIGLRRRLVAIEPEFDL